MYNQNQDNNLNKMLCFYLKCKKCGNLKKSRIMIINEKKNSMTFKVQNLKQKIFLLLMYKNHLFEDFDFHYLESSKRAFFIPKKNRTFFITTFEADRVFYKA